MTAPFSHEDWQSLIPEYVSGVLSESERAGLDGHLSGCPECRSLLADAREFHSGLSLLAGEERSRHPSTAEITDYAGNPAMLEPSERETITRHLVLCTTCAREVALLGGVNRELSAVSDSRVPAGEAPRGTSGNSQSTIRYLLRPQVAYAIAAVFVAMLAYPAYRWLTFTQATDSAIVGNAFCLAPQTRGGLRPTEIHVLPAEAVVQFALNAPFSGDYQTRACLLESKSREILRTQLTSAAADDQAILVAVPAHLLPNGDYAFKIVGVSRTAASDTMIVQYPFIVRPGRD